MHAEYLGVGYHDRIRSLLRVKKPILPDSVIDASLNINAMKLILTDEIFVPLATGQIERNAINFEKVQSAAIHVLAGVLCASLESKCPGLRKWRRVGQKQFEKARWYIESLKSSSTVPV